MSACEGMHGTGSGIMRSKRTNLNVIPWPDPRRVQVMGAYSLTWELHSRDECTLDAIISKVRGWHRRPALSRSSATQRSELLCSTRFQVQRTVVVDGDVAATAVFSKERFMEALHEEQATVVPASVPAITSSSHVAPTHVPQRATGVGEPASPPPSIAPAPMGAEADHPAEHTVTLAQAVESVRSDTQPFNWLLITPVP
jgi:hypothetical protein